MHKPTKSIETVVQKIRPQRVAARRARELLCVMNNDFNNDEEALWVEEEEVHCDYIPEFKDTDDVHGIPIINNIADWCSSPWTEIEKN